MRVTGANRKRGERSCCDRRARTSRLTVLGGDVGAQAADGPLHSLLAVEAGRVLLNGHVGQVHVGVGDVLLASAVARVGEARKARPAGRREEGGGCVWGGWGGGGDAEEYAQGGSGPSRKSGGGDVREHREGGGVRWGRGGGEGEERWG
mgnify:CR=1 FL=1